MDTKRLSAIYLAVFTGLCAVTGMLLLFEWQPAYANPGILYVSSSGNCYGASPCFSTVQAAVDAAYPGDEIRVANGTYTDIHARPRRDTTTTGVVTQTVYLSKTIIVRGGYNNDFSLWDPEVYYTKLDAQGQGRGIYITSDISPTIEGLSITGGDATGLGGYYYYGEYDVGGGVYIVTATATLVKNNISHNNATQGGGVYLGNSYSLFNDNTISTNVATNGGGGMFLYGGSATLVDNEISDNSSNNLGGGLYLFSTNATLRGNRILRNSANNLGGGVDVASCSPTLSDNVVSGNSSQKGGGIYLWYGESTLTNNVIANNQGTTAGSGLWLGGSKPRLLHTTFSLNHGGDGSGIYVSSDGSGTYSTLALTNTILVTHTIGISVTNGNTANINGILWFSTPLTISQVAATVTVQNQYTGEPAFSSDGYHLTSISAAIDKGISSSVLTDIDEQPRPFGIPDLGADEYMPPGYPIYLYLTIIKRNP